MPTARNNPDKDQIHISKISWQLRESPGLAATRTGLPPAGDDELTNKIHRYII
jgi:hypothetical protein